MRDKRYQKTEKGLDDLADLMLGRINGCIDDRTKKSVKIKSAIVTKVNEDGTVNVKLPDDESDGFSRLQNQSVYELSVGDSVEVLLKEGSFTNSWVIAKHGGGARRASLENQNSSVSVVTVNGGGGASGNISNTDLNTVVTSGNYLLGSGNTNIPDNCEGSIMAVGSSGSSAYQQIFKYAESGIMYRAYNGTAWTEWRTV